MEFGHGQDTRCKRAPALTSLTNNYSCIRGLKHNFFQDFAIQLPPEFTTNAPDPTLPLKERIAVLEEENKVLKTKVETLMAVVRK